MPRPLLSTASRRLQSTAASVKRRPIPAPTPLALDSFDAVFRASRVASIQPELAGEQVLAIPEPRNDAEWEGWDKRKERGDFGLKAELGPASGKGVFTNRGATYRNQPTQPAQPTSETPDWLPTPRFISPLGFDHAKEKSTAWRPAVGVKEAVERWIEVVPGDRVAELGGGYTRVDFEQTPELARLSDAEFQGILRKAAEPETRKRFLAWVREGMPPLDGWTPKQVEGVEGVEVVVPPGAARAFSASLIPPPASEEVHPPTFAHHIPATASAEADSSKPTASIRALLESTRSLPRIRGRVLGSNKEGGVSVGIAGFVASAPATPTLSESRRNRLVEFQVTRAVPTKDSFELEVSEVEKRKEKRVLPAAGKGKLEKPGKGLRFFGKDKGEKAVEKAADK